MKRIIIGIIILFGCLLMVGCSKEVMLDTKEELIIEPESTKTQNSNKIVLASGEWAPYVSENLKHEGVVSKIIRESFALEGKEVEYVYLPWKRSIEGAKNGKWHGTLPWLKNEEREEDFYFSDPIAHEDIVIFYKKDSGFNWETISDLKDYKIGGTTGYFYGEEFDLAEKGGKLPIERTTEDKMNFQKLAAGRVDIIISEIDVGYDLIENLFSPEEREEFIHHPKSVKITEALYLLLSKNVDGNEQSIELFNNGLKKLDESGKVEQYWKESRRGDYKKEE